jgi:DNA-binding transcriptional MerR regulator
METYNLTEAARYLNIDRSVLHYHIRNGNITPDVETPGSRRRVFTRESLDAFRRAPQRHLPQEDWDEIARRYHAGETADALAKEFNRDPEALRLKVGSRRAYLPPERWEELLRRRQSGETTAALAQEYAVSESRIRARARQAG